MSFSNIFLGSAAALSGLFAGMVINILAYHIPKVLQQNWQRQCSVLLQCDATTGTYLFSIKNLRLHCLNCDAIMPVWMNFSLLHAWFGHGRCHHCHHQMGRRYALIEIFTAIVTVVVVAHFGVNCGAASVLLLTWGLILLAVIDSIYYLLPDCVTLALIWLGLLSNVFSLFVSAEQAIVGAAVGYSSFWLLGGLYRFIRGREGMGQGDYKLLGVFGAWWGVSPLPAIVFLASIFGLIMVIINTIRGKQCYHAPLPFGPCLVVAGLIIMIFRVVLFSS